MKCDYPQSSINLSGITVQIIRRRYPRIPTDNLSAVGVHLFYYASIASNHLKFISPIVILHIFMG